MSNYENFKKTNANNMEAWMDYVPDLTHADTASVQYLSMGLDSGSTFTRFCTFDNETFEKGSVHRINSDVLDVTNIEHVRSTNKSLYSNLEFVVRDITDKAVKPDKMFTEAHFVKGSLLIGMSGSVIKQSSRVSKTKVKSTLYNILAAATLSALEHVKETNIINNCYRFNLAITMPPKDFKEKHVLETFRERICGHYIVQMPRLGFETYIRIEDNVFFENEPTAIIYDLVSCEPDDVERSLLDKTAIIVDGGGGTTDKAVVVNGHLIDEQAETGEFGGRMLLESIARIYQSETGRSKPALENIEAALDTGLLIRGNSKVDIFDYINAAKERTAQDIIKDLNDLCDSMRKSLDDIEEIVLHGRLFLPTVTADGRKSSIGDILYAKLVELTPDIAVTVVTGDEHVCNGAITSMWVDQC